MNEAEEEEANWIATRIPEIASELALKSDNTMQEEEKRREIIESIASALRFMHRDKLEPAFLQRYRKDLLSVKSCMILWMKTVNGIVSWAPVPKLNLCCRPSLNQLVPMSRLAPMPRS